ncbi:MAG: type II toxin-antitoxin system HipA family toxin, partial [Mesorhizobium sp.]
MTSKNLQECFVYITLPGETEEVVAARFEIRQSRAGPSGRLVYGRSYLQRRNAVEIDPIELQTLDGQTYVHTGDSSLFPSLRDALPDRWGRLVIDRAEGGELDDLGYLLRSPDDRAGALGFGLGATPPAPKYAFNKTLRLKELMEAADAIIADKDADPELVRRLEQLNLAGTSMGGARPKAVVEDDQGLWIAKFPRHDDRFDIPRAEHAMLRLAQEAGISAAESKLAVIGDRPVLLVKRFDREKADGGYLRHRMISSLTALQASESATQRDRWSYPLFADVLTKVDVD